MADWLTEDWAARVAGTTGDLPEIPGASGTVSLGLSGGSKREIALHWRYDGGRPGSGSAGPADQADLTFTMTAADAAQVISGEVEPSVAFMRGRLKASGDGALLLGFLESTTTDKFDGWRRAVSDLTSI
jgi:putative sterol carrier protein